MNLFGYKVNMLLYTYTHTNEHTHILKYEWALSLLKTCIRFAYVFLTLTHVYNIIIICWTCNKTTTRVLNFQCFAQRHTHIHTDTKPTHMHVYTYSKKNHVCMCGCAFLKCLPGLTSGVLLFWRFYLNLFSNWKMLNKKFFSLV